MIVLVERASLLEGCRLAEKVLPARTADPAGGHARLQAGEAGCDLHAAGPDADLRLRLRADVDEPGAALLPARQAGAILCRTDAEVLLLRSSPGRVRLEGEGAEFDLAVPDPAPPPPAEPGPPAPGWQLPAGPLAQALRRTLFAAGHPTGRYALHAVLAELGPDRLWLVATDGRRLAVAEVPLGTAGPLPAPSRHLLPAPALGLLGRLLAGTEEDVLAAFGARQALFQTSAAALRVRYVAGHFPPWQKVMPAAPRAPVPVAAGRFLAAVRQAAAVREPQGGRLTVRFGPGRVLVESRRPGQGRARVRQYLPLAGAAVEVPLRADDVVELLRAVGPEATLLWGVTGPEAPVLAATADGYRHVLMPLGRA